MRGRWGVVQSVGHRTVNADGVGSSPTAPAKFYPRRPARRHARSPESVPRILRALNFLRVLCVEPFVVLPRQPARASADGYGPLGVVIGVGGGSGRREDRAGPALNPLKGSSARLPPYVSPVRTPLAKHNPLKTQSFHLRTPGKKATPLENFPGGILAYQVCTVRGVKA